MSQVKNKKTFSKKKWACKFFTHSNQHLLEVRYTWAFCFALFDRNDIIRAYMTNDDFGPLYSNLLVTGIFWGSRVKCQGHTDLTFKKCLINS